ncbi:MAG: ATPase, partial [Desulfobacterota bacterium]|nr:ATPase [Thermodesulfobacteriota bacterium]
TVGSDPSISGRVLQYLKDQEKILPKITAKYILEKAFGKGEHEKSLQEIYDLHLKTPGMPLLESEKVIYEAISEGVKSGFLGVKEDTTIYYSEPLTPKMESIVIRGELAKKLKEEAKKEGGEEGGPPIGIEEGEKKKVGVRPAKGEGKVRNLRFRAIIPWDKLSSVINGVIRPLKEKGLPPKIVVEINATSEEGFDRTTLDSKVKETLQQINAQVMEWRENSF